MSSISKAALASVTERTLRFGGHQGGLALRPWSMTTIPALKAAPSALATMITSSLVEDEVNDGSKSAVVAQLDGLGPSALGVAQLQVDGGSRPVHR